MKVKKIYFDMDGVLADFERGVKELCHMDPPDQNDKDKNPQLDDEMWTRIKEVGNFYDKLELMPGAKEMFDLVYNKYQDRCEILTGIPKKIEELLLPEKIRRNGLRDFYLRILKFI